jgi:RNA polymerase sigma-70 factor, ECF subfamily
MSVQDWEIHLAEQIREQSDAELVQAAIRGDVESFGILYRRHYSAAVGIAYCVVADNHLAEDVAQDAFAVACRDLGRLRDADRFAGWLCGICRRLAKRAVRLRGRRKSLPTGADMPVGATSVVQQQHEMIRQAVHRLPPPLCEVVVLRYFSGLSYEQVAEMTGVSPATVRGRLMRAKQKLSADLRRQDILEK